MPGSLQRIHRVSGPIGAGPRGNNWGLRRRHSTDPATRVRSGEQSHAAMYGVVWKKRPLILSMSTHSEFKLSPTPPLKTF